MQVVGPHDHWDGPVDLFLAGGISNCPDWQSEALAMLADLDMSVANPRRVEGLEKTGPEAAKQIAWEQRTIQASRSALFWFPEESICPITLLEFGVELGRGTRRLHLGAHPNYARSFDLGEQLHLARVRSPMLPGKIHDNLPDTIASVRQAWTLAHPNGNGQVA